MVTLIDFFVCVSFCPRLIGKDQNVEVTFKIQHYAKFFRYLSVLDILLVKWEKGAAVYWLKQNIYNFNNVENQYLV